MFDKVIGYEEIKRELTQIVDMIKQPEKYEAIGAKLPHGLILVGKPGVGKTLLCEEMIEATGLPHFTIRRSKSSEDFIKDMTDTFNEAKAQAPSVILLDDIDKFSNREGRNLDSEEYVAVQSLMDDVKCSKVFVLATANEMKKLPASLLRAGRLGTTINVKAPTGKDAEEIIKYYIKDKKVSDNVNYDDINKMFSYSSCAELKSILNSAAISVAYDNREVIEMSDLVDAVLKRQYDVESDLRTVSEEKLRTTAYHEAGHLVVSEILVPESVGLASVNGKNGHMGGFVHNCVDITIRRHLIQIALGGKVAVETFLGGEVCASGCYFDLRNAYDDIKNAITTSGTLGLGLLDVSNDTNLVASEAYLLQAETAIKAELERNMFIVRDILVKNRGFVERIADALMEKRTLLFSEIQKLKSESMVA